MTPHMKASIAAAKCKLDQMTDAQLTDGLLAINDQLQGDNTLPLREYQTLELMRSCIWDVMADRVIARLGVKVPVAA